MIEIPYLEEVLVVPHGIPVGECAHLVLQHLLVDAEVGVRVEVVVLRGHLFGRKILQLLLALGRLALYGHLRGRGRQTRLWEEERRGVRGDDAIRQRFCTLTITDPFSLVLVEVLLEAGASLGDYLRFEGG